MILLVLVGLSEWLASETKIQTTRCAQDVIQLLPNMVSLILFPICDHCESDPANKLALSVNVNLKVLSIHNK